jgi:hypothetical protein
MHLTIVCNGSDISVLPFFRPCYMAGKASQINGPLAISLVGTYDPELRRSLQS